MGSCVVGVKFVRQFVASFRDYFTTVHTRMWVRKRAVVIGVDVDHASACVQLLAPTFSVH